VDLRGCPGRAAQGVFRHRDNPLDFRSYELAEPGAGIRAAIADGVARCGGAPPGLRSWRSRLLVRIVGAGATYELIAHLLPLIARRHVLLTVGWIITDTG
jgi:hypothetical protein